LANAAGPRRIDGPWTSPVDERPRSRRAGRTHLAARPGGAPPSGPGSRDSGLISHFGASDNMDYGN